jgi:hypothetical protein
MDFYRAFAKGKGTWIKSEGVDILSVTLHLGRIRLRLQIVFQ